MRLYLDDDMDANELIALLQHAGHEVMSPRAVAMRGAEDEAHLSYAAGEQYVVLTANVRDFFTLHQRWQDEGQSHAGILALYRENNPRRDMTYTQIARAVSHLEGAGLPLQNTFQNLNMWRDPARR
jgi:predicted nuclease of predicted toxin-antitoxin system